MGYLTTFSIYNDGAYELLKHPKELASALHDACIARDPDSYGLGSHANLITAQKPRHADDATVYVHMGNTLCEMNGYSSETDKLMHEHPEFYVKMLKEMEFQVKKLKKNYKEMQAKIKEQKLQSGDKVS